MTFAARVLQDPTQPIGELIVAGTTTPAAYTMFDSGFGARFANIVLAGDYSTDVAFNYNKTLIAFAKISEYLFISNTGIAIYNWSSSGFGSKYPDPYPSIVDGSPGFPLNSSGGAIGQSVAWNPIVNTVGETYITAGTWNTTITGQYTRSWRFVSPAITPPGGLITGTWKYPVLSGTAINRIAKIAYSPDGLALAFSAGKPVIFVYKLSADGLNTFISKYADPVGIDVNASGFSVAFNPAGNVIAIGTSQPSGAPTPLYVYPWSNSTGFGTKYTNPATIPGGTVYGIAFSPSGNAIAVAHNSSPYISVYPWNTSTGFGAKYANPAVLPAGPGRSVAFSDSGNYIAVGHDGGASVSVYKWDSSTGFGTKFADPINPPNSGAALVWRGG